MVTEAERALPFTQGNIIAAFMNIQHADDLDEHQHKEDYRHLGISDEQIEIAQDLVHINFESIQQRLKENPDFRGVSSKHLRQALGGEIMDLLETNMHISTEEAFEIFIHLQRLERRDRYPWSREKDTGTNDNEAETFSLDLSNVYRRPSRTPLQRNWRRYATFGAAGLGISIVSVGALFAILKKPGE